MSSIRSLIKPLPNIIVAISNFYGIPGVVSYVSQGLWLKATVIGSAIFASFFYHLIEKNKHAMPGVCCCRDDLSQAVILENDRFWALLSTFVSAHKLWTAWGAASEKILTKLLFIGITGIIGHLIPEIVSGVCSSGRHISRYIKPELKKRLNPNDYKMNRALENLLFVMGHGMWHVCAFHISNIIADL